ncbi:MULTISPECIES: serpin family protein [unclassified Streptomyces]|uniref:serpin family protein n=1 Tax=unclassified Streptomyces TaxID=2593676 RepID=UPI002E38168A|nr:serpin family protein [Streptomyces sp. NBC_01268]
MRGDTVRAVNRMTARWAGALPAGGSTVLSAAGVWPLLAPLADGAAGAAREELAEALGLPAEAAAGAARELVAGLGAIPGVASATGLWARAELRLRDSWVAGLPDAVLGRLTGDAAADRKALDAWAAERTGGLVPALPVAVDEETLLVLASAQTVRTTWVDPFWTRKARLTSGPWSGRTVTRLHRSTPALDDVGLADTEAGPLTVLRVRGDTGVDVHLLLGEPAAASGAVLRAGLDVLEGRSPAVPGDRLPTGDPGPGLEVRTARSTTPDPRLSASVPAFALSAGHDLLAHHGLFGLTAARDADRGHFPGVGDVPLAIGQGRQAATAEFTAQGFEAASVAAFGAFGAGAPPSTYTVRVVAVEVDRPFGFLAVHRASGLVLTAGWVERP